MLLLWSSYTNIVEQGGQGFHGTFEGIDEFGLVREKPLIEEERRPAENDIMLIWQVTYNEIEIV